MAGVVSFYALCTASVAIDEVAIALVKPEPTATGEHLIIQLMTGRIEFVTGKMYKVTIEEFV